jgi:hypothetical protein
MSMAGTPSIATPSVTAQTNQKAVLIGPIVIGFGGASTMWRRQGARKLCQAVCSLRFTSPRSALTRFAAPSSYVAGRAKQGWE